MADLFREVDEDVRKERYLKLCKTMGATLLRLRSGFVLVVAGVTGWREYQRSEREAEGERFATARALAEEGRHAEAALAFADLGADAGGGYAVLARFEEAAALVAGGEQRNAIAVYDAMAADGAIETSFRDLASLLAALHLMDSGADRADIEARLQPLTGETNPWRFSAREVAAIVMLNAGEHAAAREALAALVGDVDAPPDVRSRAVELVAALGTVE